MNKIDLIWKEIQKIDTSVEYFLITNMSNIKYIMQTEIEGYILISKSKSYIVTDGRYIEVANNIAKNISNMEVIDILDTDKLIKMLKDKIIAIEANDITINRLKILTEKFMFKQIVDTSNVIESIRMIKTEEEINNIQKACEITDKAFGHILKYIQTGMTEKQVKDELEYYMKKNGAEDVSFSAVVAFGANSSKPHHVSGNNKLRKQDIVLIDFGCKYNGYCSDMTRTFFVGKLTKKQEEIYNIVLDAQISAENMIKQNINVNEIDEMVRDEFKKHELEDKYLHSLGHGVGLDIHEMPAVSYRANVKLKENMVITIEPGIYLENEFGVRIEDTVLVTKNGMKSLVNSSKDIIII